ncbi:ATP-dependent Clp protease proteolytic subunit 2, mitochondrial [Phytophthora boehmeriae]|uniref:ATP-dependent Clp protease proteolytic subunit 2, mitochondrial n=1 Tax=Phytophthora boehmeriae TaxID=109152 RepID=A0A8T1WMQ5_9STRA|nr:ATP-dependent Clp protease proteolytic subunit 2, mitochondrial [Phytophthora boehmeriae]
MAQVCAVCETAEAKYKCPTCRAPYCSLVCCKKHKETPCEPQPASEKPQVPTAAAAPVNTNGATASVGTEEEEIDPEHRLPQERLDVLRSSAGVKEMLTNPAITQALTQINSSQDKMKTLEKALLDPTFAKFMYQALDEVVPPTK